MDSEGSESGPSAVFDSDLSLFLNNAELETFHNEVKELISFSHSSIGLLTGPPRSGKTSLLMRLGLNLARKGYSVLFVVFSKEKLSSSAPLPLMELMRKGLNACDDEFSLLAKITFVYAGDYERLLHYCSSLYLEQTSDSVLIVDDFPLYFKRNVCKTESDINRTFCLISNIIASDSSPGPNESGSLRYCMFCGSSADIYLDNVKKRFVPNMCVFERLEVVYDIVDRTNTPCSANAGDFCSYYDLFVCIRRPSETAERCICDKISYAIEGSALTVQTAHNAS